MSTQTNIFRYFNGATGSFSRYLAGHGGGLKLTDTELEDIRDFLAFNKQTASGHCTMCMRVLYPEEQKYRTIPDEWQICPSWKIMPLRNDEGFCMVCNYHFNNDGTSSSTRRDNRRAAEGEPLEELTPERLKDQYVYPGIRLSHFSS